MPDNKSLCIGMEAINIKQMLKGIFHAQEAKITKLGKGNIIMKFHQCITKDNLVHYLACEYNKILKSQKKAIK